MNEELREVKNTSLSFPLKHVGTCSKNTEYRDEYSIRHCVGVPMANRTANDWRVLSVLRTMETKDTKGEYAAYVALSLQQDRLLAMASGMEEVAVEHFPLFRYATKADDMKSPSTVWIDEKCLESLTFMEGENRKVKHLKIRNNRCKIMALMQYVRAWIKEQTGLDFSLDESNVKRYIESLTAKTYHVYAVDSLDQMDTTTFSKVVGLIYGLHERTNTTSCMVKGNSDRLGADYYDGFLHPFHCYRTKAWKLLLVSDKTPEQVEQVDFTNEEVKSPFLARAWATTCGTGVYYTYKFYGAKDAVDAIHTDKEIVLIHYNPTDKPLRLYKDTSGDFVCAYIDGHNYVGVDSYTEYEDKDGNIYITGFACYEDSCYANIYEPQHSSGLTEPRCKYVYCEIYEENHPEDECEYCQEIGGYVHRDFWDFNKNCLDGYAIYRYYH